jgi:hypothetical protein
MVYRPRIHSTHPVKRSRARARMSGLILALSTFLFAHTTLTPRLDSPGGVETGTSTIVDESPR